MNRAALVEQLPQTLKETDFDWLGTKYRGKVRDTYRQGDRLVLVTTDRLSAFDHVLTTIPFKGEVLNRISAFWFEKTKHVVKNHVLDVPDPNVTVARASQPFAIEVVIRGYLTGSLWRDYQKDPKTAYGITFDPGLKKDQAFEKALITPSTKEAYGKHDEPISEAELVSRGLVSARDWAKITEAARAIFAEGQRWARAQGLILVDTKYEFGKVGDEIILIDEIHTPDSSRYWVADEYDARFAQGRRPEDARQGEHPAVADPRARVLRPGHPAADPRRRAGRPREQVRRRVREDHRLAARAPPRRRDRPGAQEPRASAPALTRRRRPRSARRRPAPSARARG